MKNYLEFPMIFVWFIFTSEVKGDPFGVNESTNEQPLSKESVSTVAKLIDLELLNKFGEKEANVIRDDFRPCVRVFIDSTGKSPTLVKWFMPTKENEVSTVETKKFVVDAKGVTKIQKRSFAVTDNQVKKLRKVLERANPLELPSKDWFTGELLDDSTWVFDFPLDNSSHALVRKNPGEVWSEEIYKSSKIGFSRIAKEYNLSAFSSMLLMIADSANAD